MRKGVLGFRFGLLWLLAQVTRRWKPPGMERLVRWACPPDRSGAGCIQRIVRYEETLRIQVDTANFLEWWIFFFGRYEPEVGRWIKKSLPTGGVAVDVGANIGLFTLLMAKKVGDRGRVIAVEPHPRVFQRLHENLGLNGLNHVASFQCALGDAGGWAVLHAPDKNDPNQGKAALEMGDRRDLPIAMEVEVKTLDDLVRAEGLTRLDLIKIDAEGWDLHVLKGAENSIRAFRPFLIFEYLGSQDEPYFTVESARAWLSGFGYRLFVLHPKSAVPLNEKPPLSDCNLLARPEPFTSAREKRC